MTLRKATIRLAHENPELRPVLLPLVAGRKTAALKRHAIQRLQVLQVRTGQLYDSRVFFVDEDAVVTGATETIVKDWEAADKICGEVAKQYAALCTKQVQQEIGEHRNFPFGRQHHNWWSVDMDEWPDELMFGPWFDALMKKYNIHVDD